MSAAALAPRADEVGRVEAVADGIAIVSGLRDVRLDELVRFEHGQTGFALTLDRDALGCVLLDDIDSVEAGHQVRGTGEVVRVPVGPSLLGRTVDPLGRPLDEGPAVESRRLPAHRAPRPGDHRARFRQRAGLYRPAGASMRCSRSGAASAS